MLINILSTREGVCELTILVGSGIQGYRLFSSMVLRKKLISSFSS